MDVFFFIPRYQWSDPFAYSYTEEARCFFWRRFVIGHRVEQTNPPGLVDAGGTGSGWQTAVSTGIETKE